MPYRPSRRDLLKAGAAAGLLPALSKADAFFRQEKGVHTFCFMSDTHVGIKGRNLKECRDLMVEMNEGIKPLFCINGGDVVDYGWKPEYDGYDEVLAGMPFKTHHIPGNHDVRWSPLGLKIFHERVGKPYSSFDNFGCHFILLDSTVPLSHWGHYESEQLRWLENDLKKVGREMPVFVFTHHWVGRDKIMVDNERDLITLIEPYNVKLIFNGHGHSDLLWQTNGVVSTMNKGLYQGSYQQVDVDLGTSEVRLSRRTAQKPKQSLLATVSLAAAKEKRPVWSLSTATIVAGQPLPVSALPIKEANWNGSGWFAANGALPTGDLVGGVNVLDVRTDAEGGRNQVLEVLVKKPSSRLQPRWERALSGGVMSHLLLANDSLYVSAMDGSVYRLDKKDGKVLWRAKTGDYCHSSPATDGKHLVIGSADANVYGFDAHTGQLLWKHETGGPVYASAAFARGVAAIASGDGKVYGFDLTDGALKWTFILPPGNSSFAQSPATTDGQRIYIGAWDNYLYCLDATTGTQIWRQICCEKTFAFSPAIGAPHVQSGVVYVPANGNVLYAFNALTGSPVWTFSSPEKRDKVGYSGPVVFGADLYIGCLGALGEVRCVSTADGKERWCATTGAEIYDSSPGFAEGHVAIGCVNGLLSVIRGADGRIIEQYRMPTGHFLSSPAAEKGSIYAATYSDRVVAFDWKL
jgi:outer membrane protein assembly factor BamB